MITETTTSTIQVSPAKQIDIEKLIETSLPSSAASLMKIRTMLNDVNTSGSAISSAIIYHPSLLARILRLVNSPIYSTGKAISSIPTAINIIGTKVLSDIVAIEITSSAFKKMIQTSECARKVWEHSLAVGFIARKLSEILKLKDSDEVFTCGLLHDLGKMLLLSQDSEGYKDIGDAEKDIEMLQRERLRYGHTHTEIGALIAHRWGLPEDICYTILYHHDSSQATKCATMICLIDLGDIIANSRGYGLRKFDEKDILCDELLYSQSAILLNLTKETIDELCGAKIDESLQELINTFSQ